MPRSLPTTPVAVLPHPNGAAVHALTYSSPDPATLSSLYLLTGAADRTIRLWNPVRAAEHYAANPKDLHSIRAKKDSRPPGLVQTYTAGHAHPVTCVAVSRANDKFVSAGGDKQVLLWDVTAGHVIRRWEGHSAQINAVLFAGDYKEDNLVISAGYDATVRMWDLRQTSSSKAAMLMVMSEARDAVTSLVLSHYGTSLWAGSVDGRVRNYDFRMGRVLTDVMGGNAVTSLSVTRTGDAILVGTLDSALRLIDCQSGRLLQSFRGTQEKEFTNTKYRLRSTLAMNDAIILSGTENGQIIGWDVAAGEAKWEMRHQLGQGSEYAKEVVVGCVVECSTREEWCSAGGDGMAVVWAHPKT